MNKHRFARLGGLIAAALAGMGLAAASQPPTLHQHDDVKMKGKIDWHYIDATGRKVTGAEAIALGAPAALANGGHIDNLVVTAGKTLMAQLWTAQAVAAPSHLAIGSDATAVVVGQTQLVAETARVALDTRTNTANVATVIGTIPAGTGTGNVNEVGLFNATPAGTMSQRALTGAIVKPAGLGLQFTWTTTFN